MSLKNIVFNEVCMKIFDPLFKERVWRILVMDDITTVILSDIMKMNVLYEKGITLVNDIHKRREPVPLEAIYVLTPRQNIIELFVNDFVNIPTYKKVHLFFTDELSATNMELLAGSLAANFVVTLKEVYMSFLVKESSVFTVDLRPLECQKTSGAMGATQCARNESDSLYQDWARSLVAVCACLHESPRLITHRTEKARQFASRFKEEMLKHTMHNPKLGTAIHRDKSVLLILDRSYDPLTPLMHDLHLQSMAYDLMDIKDDVYSYKNHDTGNLVSFNLSEDDENWSQLRHKHIADTSRILSVRLQQMIHVQRNLETDTATTKALPATTANGNESCVATETEGGGRNVTQQLRFAMKKLPHIRREAISVSNLFYLSEACLSVYKMGINELCNCEQNLAMGTDATGEHIKHHDRAVGELLNSVKATASEKLRLLLVMVLTQNGMNNECVMEMIEKFNIDDKVYACLMGLFRLGNFMQHGEIPRVIPNKAYYLMTHRSQLPDLSQYTVSRWIPFLQDLAEDVISGREHPALVQYQSANPSRVELSALDSGSKQLSTPELGSFRRSWADTDPAYEADKHIGPRLIVFVLGGVSYSESRVAYDLNQRCQAMRAGVKPFTAGVTPRNQQGCASRLENGGGRGWSWDIVVGSTELLTPETFLNLLMDKAAC